MNRHLQTGDANRPPAKEGRRRWEENLVLVMVGVLRKRVRIRKPQLSTIMTALGILLAVVLLSSTIGRQIISGKEPSLVSFAVINFGGYLFFLLMPVEALVPYYVAEGYNSLLIGAVALATAMLAQSIDYLTGYFLPDQSIENLLGTAKYRRFRSIVERYGKTIILIFNLFPLSSPVVVLIAGLEQYGLRVTMRYCFWGLLIKYSVLIALVYPVLT
jgi:membrane protein YqaA with SNARE-associated domain